jgi:hypothetical protein
VFESSEELLREDEIEYVKLMIFKKLKESGNSAFAPEVKRYCEPVIQKAYNSLEVLTRELLTEEHYMHEFDKIFLEREFEGNLIRKLQYLLERLVSLFSFREEALSFLYKVQ